MEVKREVKMEWLEGLEEMDEASFRVKGRGDNVKKRSFELKMNSLLLSSSPSGETVRKTKSLDPGIIVNIDDLVNNVTGGSQMGFFSLAKSPRPCDVKQLQDSNPETEDSKMDTCLPVEDDDSDSYKWRKLHIEATLPIYLKFEDVRYKVTVRGEKYSNAEKCILHGITGCVSPGEVLALMGPSGGGKTTLLNLLSGRVKSNVGGTISYNDKPYNKSLKRRIGFVLQDDVVFPHLTVKETLTYSALLRLPNTLTKDQKRERAINVIGELGLERCQDTIIGGAFVRGISGGERKRVCIGNEVLLNPSLLFLDEPTSGLDSTSALRVFQMLQNIAQAGKTVVATIHQPSSRLFTKFDRLILLGKGCSLYSGKGSEAMQYFSSIGCSPSIALNPAEFLIDLANGNMMDKSVPSELQDKFLVHSPISETQKGPSPGDVHEYLVGAYESKVANKEKRKLLQPLVIRGNHEIEGWSNSREWGAPWFEQFSILFRRGLKERRHENLSGVRVIQVISTAIIVGLLWWNSDASTPTRLHDQGGLLFFISVFWAFFPLFIAIFTFPQERAMLVKERSVDMYKLSAYLIARNISDLPLDLILPILFLLIVYIMTGLKSDFHAFFLTLLTIFLSIVAAQGLGLTIGAAFMDVKKATTFASVTVMVFMLTGGFFIQNVPACVSWLRYISFNHHTYRLLLKIQYNCSSNYCKYPFINGRRLDRDGAEVGALFVMIIGYRMLAYLFLRRMKLRTMT